MDSGNGVLGGEDRGRFYIEAWALFGSFTIFEIDWGAANEQCVGSCSDRAGDPGVIASVLGRRSAVV